MTGTVPPFQPIQGGKGGTPALAHEPRILDRLADDLDRAGLVAERIACAHLIYLALVTRLHDRPVSVVVKGPSSGGKSWTLGAALKFVPAEAVHQMTGGSEKSLAYGDVPLAHKHLVIYEAGGLAGETASYLIRSLLSEGRVQWETVESTKEGLKPKTITREGPTGLLTTTTLVSLHPENETRLLSVTVPDTPEATRAVLLAWGKAAAGGKSEPVDYEPWHELGRWLEVGEREVVIPFAPRLAELIPPRTQRLARDFIQVLALTKAHALLHRATRERDSDGRIVAAIEDYAVVRELVEEIVSEGAEAAVSDGVRALTEAVRDLHPQHKEGVTQAVLSERLGLSRASVSRRTRAATAAGYVRNAEDRRGRPARLTPGEDLPLDEAILPAPEALGDGYPLPPELPETVEHLPGPGF